MAAAAFKGTFLVRDLATGKTQALYAAFDDVAANAVTWGASGASDVQIAGNSVLYDAILETGGTDTLRSDILVNDNYTGNQLAHKANLNTTVNRQIQSMPMGIRGGSRLRLIQRA